MKFSPLALVATVAVASAVECDVTKISPLLTDPNVDTCTLDSGFSFKTLSTPTAESLPKLCASAACKSVLTAVKGLGLGDCTLVGKKVETDLVTPIETVCASSSSSSATATTTNATGTGGNTAGSSTGGSADAATVGSSTTTTSDSKTVTTSNGGSFGGASESTVDTPAASSTTTTPAPTTTSSASSVAMAASAMVIAVTAAFL